MAHVAEAAGGGACQSNSSDDAAVLLLMCVCCFPPFFLQAINGGNATWFGVNVPFDLNTLLAIVSKAAAAALTGQYACNSNSMLAASSSSMLQPAVVSLQQQQLSGSPVRDFWQRDLYMLPCDQLVTYSMRNGSCKQ